MNAPCYKCKKRKIGCHSFCEMYRRYDEENKKRRKQQTMERISARANRDRLDKHCRGKGNF